MMVIEFLLSVGTENGRSVTTPLQRLLDEEQQLEKADEENKKKGADLSSMEEKLKNATTLSTEFDSKLTQVRTELVDLMAKSEELEKENSELKGQLVTAVNGRSDAERRLDELKREVQSRELERSPEKDSQGNEKSHSILKRLLPGTGKSPKKHSSQTTQIIIKWQRSSADEVLPKSVLLSGAFWKWCEPKSMSQRASEPGCWETELDLPSGRYEFKFVVDGQWRCSEAYQTCSDERMGIENNFLDV